MSLIWGPFPKPQTCSEIFGDLAIDEEMIIGVLFYLFICKVTTKKVIFQFYKQSSQAATCLICKQAIFLGKMQVSFFSSDIPVDNEKKSHGKII